MKGWSWSDCWRAENGGEEWSGGTCQCQLEAMALSAERRAPRGEERRGQKEAINGRSISRAAGRGAAAGRAESSRDRMGSCARECASFRPRAAPESRKSRHSRDSTGLDAARLDATRLERHETAEQSASAPRRLTRLLSAIINIDVRTLGNPLSAPRCDFAMRFGASRPPHSLRFFTLSARKSFKKTSTTRNAIYTGK